MIECMTGDQPWTGREQIPVPTRIWSDPVAYLLGHELRRASSCAYGRFQDAFSHDLVYSFSQTVSDSPRCRCPSKQGVLKL